LTPIDFLRRLETLIPPPRRHLTRDHGVFAPHHHLRATIVHAAAAEQPHSAPPVTLDGRRVVSASADGTLKVWDLATYTCRITHRGDAGYFAVAVNATTVAAGDESGAVWFLDLPRTVASSIDAYVDCVVGMAGGTVDPAATSFSIGLYGGLGEGEWVAAAFNQGCAAIGMTSAGDPDAGRRERTSGFRSSDSRLTRLACYADRPVQQMGTITTLSYKQLLTLNSTANGSSTDHVAWRMIM
jgi:hypothetical protein